MSEKKVIERKMEVDKESWNKFKGRVVAKGNSVMREAGKIIEKTAETNGDIEDLIEDLEQHFKEWDSKYGDDDFNTMSRTYRFLCRIAGIEPKDTRKLYETGGDRD